MTDVYVIRVYSKRYVGASRPEAPRANGAPSGWRPWRWVEDLADAEKWASELAAQAWAQGVLRGPYEVRKVRPGGGAPEGVGGRVRIQMGERMAA